MVYLSDTLTRMRNSFSPVAGGGILMPPASAQDFLRSLDAAADEARRQEAELEQLRWNARARADATRNMAVVARVDAATETGEAEAACARVAERLKRLGQSEPSPLQRVAAQIRAARPSVVIQIGPYARVTRTLNEGDVAAAVNAIADAIGVARPIDALHGDAPPPRDPLDRDLAEDGA